MSFENIFTHGNLVDVTVRQWSAEKKLQPEDLGLKNNLSKVFSLGHKKLIPAEVIFQFERLAYKARYLLERFGFQFEFGNVRFVPKKAMVEFATEMDKLIVEYNRLADDLVANYSKYRLQVRQEFVDAATKAYQRAKSLCGYKGGKDEFINAFLERIEKSYPEASDLRSKFSMEYTVFTAGLPDLATATFEDVAEEQDKIRLMQDVYVKGLTRKVNEFVDKIVSEQRNRARVILENFIKSLRNEKKFHSLSIKAVVTMIEEYERMDIVGDTALLKTLKEFKARVLDVYSSKDFRSSKSLRSSVSDEVQILLTNLCDRSALEALATKYRHSINL